ncbi:hypothetical protein DGo_PC0178 (plasmid) [Deinococcus gobiensis I-0]|uniref:Uncharacterized protein n=1 Tax=Deinococcus gobiensis (strain DSM 21396 / JCM 16679 / CGMCC 1.7299 / I-0) TaxID=745776 RepID=H8H373_DEIGI|nr:hypothetical protein DGo_PC0178 [Deinococcus gobiensis I-0]
MVKFEKVMQARYIIWDVSSSTRRAAQLVVTLRSYPLSQLQGMPS